MEIYLSTHFAPSNRKIRVVLMVATLAVDNDSLHDWECSASCDGLCIHDHWCTLRNGWHSIWRLCGGLRWPTTLERQHAAALHKKPVSATTTNLARQLQHSTTISACFSLEPPCRQLERLGAPRMLGGTS